MKRSEDRILTTHVAGSDCGARDADAAFGMRR
jgi:hypothetical protein